MMCAALVVRAHKSLQEARAISVREMTEPEYGGWVSVKLIPVSIVMSILFFVLSFVSAIFIILAD
jgi:hypothetical protein